MSHTLVEQYVVDDSPVYVECFVYQDENGEEYSIYIGQDGEEVSLNSLNHDYDKWSDL